MDGASKTKGAALLVSAKDFFSVLVDDALEARRVETFPLVRDYLVRLLEGFLRADDSRDSADGPRPPIRTLAETLLHASQLDTGPRHELLKRLGDTSLYVSGFFGDSLHRKIVDIDYYVSIGGLAFGTLAKETREDLQAQMYDEVSNRFLDYVDVLTVVSQRSMIRSDQDVLRLYSRYLTTGSELARDQLIERGLLNAQVSARKRESQ
jgi:hypothetical protein